MWNRETGKAKGRKNKSKKEGREEKELTKRSKGDN